MPILCSTAPAFSAAVITTGDTITPSSHSRAGAVAVRADLLRRVLSVPDSVVDVLPVESAAHVLGSGVSFSDAHDVLEHLVVLGHATRTEHEFAYRIHPAHRLPVSQDLHGPVLRYLGWFLGRACAADRTIRPHARRPAPPSPHAGGVVFDSVAQAVDWYTDHARHLRGLLLLASQLDPDITWRAGVALWSLDRWIGAHQTAVEAQMIGLKAAQRSATLSHRERLLARAEHLARAAISLTDMGRHHAALPLCDEAVDIATLHAHSAAFSDILAARARVRRAVGDTGPALADLHLALEYTRDEHDRALRHRDRAVLHADLGRYDDALLDLDQAAPLMLNAGDHLGHARAAMNRADILVRADRADRAGEAAVLLAGALPVIARSGSPLHLAEAQNASGRCARAMGDLSGAVAWYTAARASYLAARRPDHAHAVHLVMLCCASSTPPRTVTRSRHPASLAPRGRDGRVDAGCTGGAP